TRFSRDWSSDVCSSDLSLLLVAPALGFLLLAGSVSAFTDLARDLGRLESNLRAPALGAEPEPVTGLQGGGVRLQKVPSSNPGQRSEERRVGKECRPRWA